MGPFLWIMNASKMLGVAGIIAIVLDVIAYHSFRKGNLLPFDSPIDENEEVLAKFDIDKDVDDGGFFFALGTAPAHVEDKLQDAWLEFAEATEESKNGGLKNGGLKDEGLKDGGIIPGLVKVVALRDGSEVSKVGDKFLKGFPKDQSSTSSPKILKVGSLKDDRTGTKKAVIRVIKKASAACREEPVNVKAWQNACHPEQRLRFWSDPDTELELAKNANVTIFRMGVDWSRIMPVEPINGIDAAIQWDAVTRYREIIEKVRAHGMGVMLTLFHHSLPSWAAKFGGWRNPKTLKYFVEFARVVIEKYADLVDYWITFNEPHVFTLLTYFAGIWPGGNANLLEILTSIMPNGIFKVIMGAMVEAHVQSYDIIHEVSNKLSKRAKVGVAHHVSFMRPYGLLDVPVAIFSDLMTRFAFLDDTVRKLDYIGINYYGQEVVNTPRLKHVERDEYSESGRGVYPDGLFRVLTSFHERYKKYNLPFIITENGVSDSTDFIRRPYITEHLLAIHAAMSKGVPVQGYCFWTTSDNWEWADGYGPKFGLVAVDRHHDLARIPRPSYHLFAEISKTGIVTKKQRDGVWQELQTAVEEGMKRPFCRGMDDHGLMTATGLDTPLEIPLVQRDWRFGHYVMEGLQDPLSRFLRFALTGLFLGEKKRLHPGEKEGPDHHSLVSLKKKYETNGVSFNLVLKEVADGKKILLEPLLEEVTACTQAN